MIKKVIGVVGGMGPMAGIALVESITRNTTAHCDQEHLSTILISNPEIVDRTQFLDGLCDENPAYQIVDSIIKLERCGAEVVGIACNTSYSPEVHDITLDELNRKGSRVKLLNLPLETCKAMSQTEADICKVGIMATYGTYKSKIYETLLCSYGYEVILPDLDFQKNVVHQIIYNSEFGIKSNAHRVVPKAKEMFVRALNFFRVNQADAVVLACTELSFPFKDLYPEDIIIIDPVDCFAKALIREATVGNDTSNTELTSTNTYHA